mmetsp:Transcript_15143/g.43233  ORF Transcript_15143/g.43233 Transcript_15143/m.43233 type:complete len:797 (+) Transcript_15143:15-2405(+)
MAIGAAQGGRQWGSLFASVTPSSSSPEAEERPPGSGGAMPGDGNGAAEAGRGVRFGEPAKAPNDGKENKEAAAKQKQEKQEALRRALTLASSKTTNTDGSSLGGIVNVMAFFGLMKGRYKAAYTIEEVEAKLYDIQHHDGQTRLVQQKSIISVDEEELDEEMNDVRSRVIRCFTDRSAKYAALVMLFSVVCTFAVTPLTFIFGGDWSASTEEGTFADMRAAIAVDIAMDLIYAGYLLLQLNTSFMHPTRRVEVTSRRRILRRWALSPLYYVKWLSTTTYLWIASCDASLLLNNIKFVRVVHWVALPDPLWLSEDNSVLRLGRLLFLLVGCSHWVACVLFWGGGYREELFALGEDAPLLRLNGEELPGTGHVRLYLMALVESIYMMTGALDNPLGDGSARENNLASLILVSVFGPIGMVVVAILIAAVVREQALEFALEIRHEENMAFVTRALENLNIPAELQRRVVSLHYFQKMSHDSEAFHHLFNKNNLSVPLEDAIRVYLYHKVLMSPFFTHGGPNYLLAVVRVLEDRMYLPGDYVARRGEVGAEMFFISRGELSVLVPGGGSEDIADAVLIAGRKGKGHHFGEVALVKRSLRTAWVRAETYVIVSVLHRHCIEDIWEFFPQEREALLSVVTQTMERDKARNKKGWKEAAQEAVATAAAPPHARASRSSRGPAMCNVAALAMRRASVAQRAQDAEADEAAEDPEERRHRQAMDAAGHQAQRLESLEQQVTQLTSLLGDALSLGARTDKHHGSAKPVRKRTHAPRGSEAQLLARGAEAAGRGAGAEPGEDRRGME